MEIFSSSNSQSKPQLHSEEIDSFQADIKNEDSYFIPRTQIYSIQQDSLVYQNRMQFYNGGQTKTQSLHHQNTYQNYQQQKQIKELEKNSQQKQQQPKAEEKDIKRKDFSFNKNWNQIGFNHSKTNEQNKIYAYTQSFKNQERINNHIQLGQTSILVQNFISNNTFGKIQHKKINSHLPSFQDKIKQKSKSDKKYKIRYISPNKPTTLNRHLLRKVIQSKDDTTSDIQLSQLTQVQLIQRNEQMMKKISELNTKYQQSLKSNNYLYSVILNTELNLKKQQVATQKDKIKNLINLQKRTTLEYQQKLIRDIAQLRTKLQTMKREIKQITASIKKSDDNILIIAAENHKFNQIAVFKSEIVTTMIEIQKNKNTLKQLNLKCQSCSRRIEQTTINMKSINQLDYIQFDNAHDVLFQKYLNLKIEYVLKEQQKQKIQQSLKTQIKNKKIENQLIKQQKQNQSVTIQKINRINQIIKRKINQISTKTFDQSFAVNSESQDNNIHRSRIKLNHQSASLNNIKFHTQDIYNSRIFSPQKQKKLNTSSLYSEKKIIRNQFHLITPINQNRSYKNKKSEKISDLQTILKQDMNSDEREDHNIDWKKLVLHKQKKGTQRIRNRLMKGLNMRIKTETQNETDSQKLPQLIKKKTEVIDFENFETTPKNTIDQKLTQQIKKLQQKTISKKPQTFINLLEIKESQDQQLK